MILLPLGLMAAPAPAPPGPAPLLLDTLAAAPLLAVSARRLRAAYAGPAMRVRRSADNTEQDIGFTAAGDLDTAALLAFCGTGSGFVSRWHCQAAGGPDLVQATASRQPRIVASGALLRFGAGRPAAPRSDRVPGEHVARPVERMERALERRQRVVEHRAHRPALAAVHRAHRPRAEDSLEAARPALEALVFSAAHRLAHLLPASPLEACLVEELQRAHPPHPPLGSVELQSPATLQSHPCLEVPQPEPLQQHPQPRRLVALEVRIFLRVHRDILI